MRFVCQKRCWTLVGLLLLVLPCAAQLQVGDNFQMKGSGIVSFGYAGNYGDQSVSGHSVDLGGNGTLSGFYYNPGFLSFDVMPFYNRNRDNSTFQSLTDSSGVDATANIFSGSHFPGSISYMRNYNSSGTIGNLELPNFTTHGNSQSFGIGWSALLPNLPTLSASYTTGSGDSTVYGTTSHSTSDTSTFNLRSGYSLAGFGLNGYYTHTALDSTTPEFLGGQQELISNATSDGYGGSLSHALPLHGAFSAYFNRLNYNNDYQGGIGYGSTIDSENATAIFRPTRKLNLTFGEYYTDNLAGSLNQAIVSAGGVTPLPLSASSHSWSLSGGADYNIVPGLWVSGQATRIDQRYAGQSYQSTLFNGTLYGDYGRKLFGLIRWSVSLIDTANEGGNSSVGVLGTLDFSRKIKQWDVSSNFNLAHNVQTLLVIYRNSYYRYSGEVGRRLNQRVRVSGGFSISHSALSAVADSGSTSKNFTGSLSVGWFSTSGNYATSSGNTILTANGLQPTPVPIAVLPTGQVVLFSGSSYGISVAATPVRRLTLAASYAKARSDTVANSLTSLNRNDLFNTTLRYDLRKLSFKAGYSRLLQGISAGGTAPITVSTYYIGVYRWFNLF